MRQAPEMQPVDSRPAPSPTEDRAYTERLERLGGAWWKRLLDVQRPYRWNLRRLALGYTLDVGCGLGRNLDNLRRLGTDAVGVDHNAESVAVARRRGLTAFTPAELRASPQARPGGFDALLCAHVLEHMRRPEAAALLREYLPYVRPGGRVVLITPQEAGFRSDATHVELLDLAALDSLAREVEVIPERAYSFPFPRLAGP